MTIRERAKGRRMGTLSRRLLGIGLQRVGDIMKTRDGRGLMEQAIGECGAVAAHYGYPLPQRVAAELRDRLLDDTSSWAASMMRDIAQNAGRIEADAIVGDLLARAVAAGRDLPLSRIAYCHLQVYQRQHG